jgi:hypothetical protein
MRIDGLELQMSRGFSLKKKPRFVIRMLIRKDEKGAKR